MPFLLTLLLLQAGGPVDRLIERLGDDSIAVRTRAQEELLRRGPSMIPPLRRVVRIFRDPEVRHRARWILERLRWRPAEHRFDLWLARRGIPRGSLEKEDPGIFLDWLPDARVFFRRTGGTLCALILRRSGEVLCLADYREAMRVTPALFGSVRTRSAKDRVQLARACLSLLNPLVAARFIPIPGAFGEPAPDGRGGVRSRSRHFILRFTFEKGFLRKVDLTYDYGGIDGDGS